MKRSISTIAILCCLLSIISTGLSAQVSINTDGSVPDAAAMLDVKSTDKGFLPPRMSTAQRDNISSSPSGGPIPEGLTIYNTDSKSLEFWDGTAWRQTHYFASNGNFVCGAGFTDYRDGNTYATVQIGTQCWMKENLNYQTAAGKCYNDNPANCNLYGRLYDWDDMMNGSGSTLQNPSGVRGICPAGWHLPSDPEYQQLETFLGGSVVAGGKLKSTRTDPNPHPRWNSPNVLATNESGFSALPGGLNNSGAYQSMGTFAYYWTATSHADYGGSVYHGMYRRLYYNDGEVETNHTDKTQAMSVRCVRD